MAIPVSAKRQKSSDSGGQPPSGGYPQGSPYRGPQFQQGAYNGPPGQHFPMQPQAGYNNNMWQGQQQPPFGNQVPYGQQGMYRQSPPIVPNGGPPPMHGNNWGGGPGYRGQPPNQPGGGQSSGRRGGKGSKSKSPNKNSSGGGSALSSGPPYQQGWQGQQQQFPPMQNQWGGGGGPSQMWQGGPGGPPRHPPQPSPPPIPVQPMIPMNQSVWSGGPQSSPTRHSKKSRTRGSPDGMMGGFPQGGMMGGLPADVLCTPIGLEGSATPDMFVSSTGAGPGADDDGPRKPSGGSSVASREKGRGSYRCGRCGVPKKGHVCPYQPKLKRRPDEPPPETRNAAIQVEMDEFMTLRRLNLEIQGYPESYATASHMLENSVIGEPHPYALSGDGVISHMGYMGNEPMPGMGHLSVPPHVSSQPPMTGGEEDDDPPPQENEAPPSLTMTGTEPMETMPADAVSVEKEKTAAV
mmetsp:Transcript_5847/g.10638  ORF Transcript_5847/g.10638 Transcript_5847/m.10638 type:complete len:464 (+) Transcript_5847:224-1615(+)|eukprot:CAMPEP_0202497018 /NCGR_PEP_ID=MMETSP1361-20130828/21665_1 /ASSEMBLY_ACC=CAM_ASM_000849 /TAXON_ID=210615 /ORGANISM="Staurosira complex sp., Strain CCMP2646" /LENGTH=463 /DNA_ID=CAMNT_0049128501 /DNA_START=178 /DNA_END=1569 /DNA_ORIENTATION=+